MAALGMALLSGLGLAELEQRFLPVTTAQTGNAGHAAALLLGIIQLAILLYNPVEQIPAQKDKAAGEAFVGRLEQLFGEVLVFNHGFYSRLAGKQAYLHSAPFSDVLGANIPKTDIENYQRRQAVIDMFDQTIADQYFNWIILDDPNTSWTPYYLFFEDITPQGNALTPVTGASARPASLTVKNPVARGGEMPLTDPTFDFVFSQGWLKLDDGRWAMGPRAELELFLERERYELEITVKPNCKNDHSRVEKMIFGWNEHHLGAVQFNSCESQSINVDLPKKLIRKNANNLWFEFEGVNDEQSASEPEAMAQALVEFKTIAFIPE